MDRFTDPSGHVWAFDKSTDSSFRARPQKLAKEGGFYNAPFLEGTEIDPTLLEQDLAGLETEAARIISSWVRLIETGHKAITISKTDRQTIATYIAVQALRTSEQRVALGQTIGTRMSERDLQSFHVGMLLADSAVDKLAETIHNGIWLFGCNDTSVPFYTSDHPVAARVHPQRRCIHAFQLRVRGAEVMLPLSAILMFYCYERSYFGHIDRLDGYVSPVRFTAEFVEAENQCQVGHSRRFVFCDSDAFGFARAFCTEHPVVRDPNRSRFVP